MKPQNVLLMKNGAVKLCDFGYVDVVLQPEALRRLKLVASFYSILNNLAAGLQGP